MLINKVVRIQNFFVQNTHKLLFSTQTKASGHNFNLKLKFLNFYLLPNFWLNVATQVAESITFYIVCVTKVEMSYWVLLYVCVLGCVCVCVWVCVCVCVFMGVCVWLCVFVFVCVFVYMSWTSHKVALWKKNQQLVCQLTERHNLYWFKLKR